MAWKPLNQQLPKSGKVYLRQAQRLFISHAFFYTSATRQALADQVMAISLSSLAASRGRGQRGDKPLQGKIAGANTSRTALASRPQDHRPIFS